jgi:hypothetical protein
MVFSATFDVPLLARWKHYDPAMSYVVKGCCLHNILPRALQAASAGSKTSSTERLDSIVRRYLDSLCPISHDPLEDMLECDQVHAAENAKRQQKLLEYWTRPAFLEEVLLMKVLLQPFSAYMDELFRRTAAVHELAQLLQHDFGTLECLYLISYQCTFFFFFGWCFSFLMGILHHCPLR